jgi:hypothetical protein
MRMQTGGFHVCADSCYSGCLTGEPARDKRDPARHCGYQQLPAMPGQGALAENVSLTPALLRLDPMFDPLRNDRLFQNSARKNSRESAGREVLGNHR